MPRKFVADAIVRDRTRAKATCECPQRAKKIHRRCCKDGKNGKNGTNGKNAPFSFPWQAEGREDTTSLAFVPFEVTDFNQTDGSAQPPWAAPYAFSPRASGVWLTYGSLTIQNHANLPATAIVELFQAIGTDAVPSSLQFTAPLIAANSKFDFTFTGQIYFPDSAIASNAAFGLHVIPSAGANLTVLGTPPRLWGGERVSAGNQVSAVQALPAQVVAELAALGI